ncbi:conserved phage C-terminal domain-containing protein [Holdemania massiliensis]|uniref:conserved phage C-terminal domain-containing protein n=1 Tax=Holdemania massiliensis TaxID=1468449 RepID=UPI00242C2CB0|nr:conserved phage C-terminal domain-containing protein [Holdemania massiliensis]
MPSRIIKESICTSETLAALSAEAERLFYRIIVKCDDYGCYYGSRQIIKNTCFPLIASCISDEEFYNNIGELEAAGLIEFYTVNNREYLHVVTWANHQQIRSKKPKFPQPIQSVFPDEKPDDQQKEIDLKKAHENEISKSQIDEENNHLKSSEINESLCGDRAEITNENLKSNDINGLQKSPEFVIRNSEFEKRNAEFGIRYVFFGEQLSGRTIEEFVRDVIFYLNFKAKKNFSPTDPVCTQYAQERLQEGFDPQDFFTIIVKKATEWGNSNTMNRYLQPSTLFSSKNFKNYRDQQTRVDVLPDYMEREKAGLPPLEEEG